MELGCGKLNEPTIAEQIDREDEPLLKKCSNKRD
jgi:hypothetical protein